MQINCETITLYFSFNHLPNPAISRIPIYGGEFSAVPFIVEIICCKTHA